MYSPMPCTVLYISGIEAIWAKLQWQLATSWDHINEYGTSKIKDENKKFYYPIYFDWKSNIMEDLVRGDGLIS